MPKRERSITKKTSIKHFCKENTEMRIGSEAIDTMLANLDDLARLIVKKAEAACLADERTTIMDRDMEAAFKSVGGSVDETPEGIFTAVEKMKAEEIGKIALKIADWVKQNRK